MDDQVCQFPENPTLFRSCSLIVASSRIALFFCVRVKVKDDRFRLCVNSLTPRPLRSRSLRAATLRNASFFCATWVKFL